MEETVTTSLERYNRLLELAKQAKQPKAHTIYIENNIYSYRRGTVITDSEAVKVLAEELQEALCELGDLKSRIAELDSVTVICGMAILPYHKLKNIIEVK